MQRWLPLSKSGVVVLAVLLTVGAALPATAGSGAGATGGDSENAVERLAKRIDARIEARWREAGVTPAPIADDAEFLRRTYLNIAGRIPTVSETRRFLDDAAPDKRQRLARMLLEGPGYVTNFTYVYRNLLIPEADADFQAQFMTSGFESWIRRQLIDNRGYDRFTRDLLTAPLGGDAAQAMQQAGPQAFYRIKQAKPENLAAAVSRLYLGVQLDCAQCHDHPFTNWRQEDFWGFAAFFAGIGSAEDNLLSEDVEQRRLKIPETEKVVLATFLDGSQPTWSDGQSPRSALADWLTSADNPFFARAAANRVWAHLFGVGIVQPVDDFDAANPPSHPELLDELAQAFADSGYDVPLLIQAITASRAYQLTSRQTHESQADERLFARMAVRGFTARQLFDSLQQAVGFGESTEMMNPAAVDRSSPAQMVRDLFREGESDATDSQTTILQALALMNSELLDSATDPQRSTTLGAVIEFPYWDTAGRIEALYLATLNRRPTPDELSRLVAYVDRGGTHSGSRPELDGLFQSELSGQERNRLKDSHIALGDVFWALLNSSEFRLNH